MMVYQHMPLPVVLLPLTLIVITTINIIREKSTWKLFIYGLIFTVIYVSILCCIAYFSKTNEWLLDIIKFPFIE